MRPIGGNMSAKSKKALSSALGLLIFLALILVHKGAFTTENIYLALSVSLALAMSVRFNA